MSDIIATGTSGYASGAIDTASTLVANVSPISVKHPNGLASAVVQLETILGSGTSLKGTLANLVTRLAVLIESTGLLKAGVTIPTPVIQGNVTGTYALRGTATIPGATITGSVLTMNPYAVTTVVTPIIHGLGTTPEFTHWYLECVSTDAGYAVGDRVYIISDTAASRGFSIHANSTTVGIVTDGSLPAIQNKSTTTSTAITAAKWKLVVTPCRLVV